MLKNGSKGREQHTTWVVAAVGIVVFLIATFVNYGSDLRKSLHADVKATVAPDNVTTVK
jgi:hypothetical protein